MTPDELVNAALVAIWPETREPKRTKEIWGHRRSRYADMALMTAAEMILDGRHGERAEALHTEALSRAGIKPKQFASLAPWAQERVMQATQQMIAIRKPTADRKRPGKTRSIEHEGRTYTLTGKGSVKQNSGKCSVYSVVADGIEYEDIIMPTGRSIADHLTMTGGPKPKETSVPETSKAKASPRRGRPPKGGAAMTGAERQRVLQERRKAAEAALVEIQKHVDFALREKPVPPHDRRLLTRMQEIDKILKRLSV